MGLWFRFSFVGTLGAANNGRLDCIVEVWLTTTTSVVNIKYAYIFLNVRAYYSKIVFCGSYLLGGER